MARVIWSEPALFELDEIADYISIENPTAAKKLVREVFKQVSLLISYPELGKVLDKLESTVYREIVLPPCRIFYRIDGDKIFIIHIIREEQLLHLDLLRLR